MLEQNFLQVFDEGFGVVMIVSGMGEHASVEAVELQRLTINVDDARTLANELIKLANKYDISVNTPNAERHK